MIGNTSKKGLPDGWTRATLIIKEEHCEKLRSIAYWERTTIKDVVDQILSRQFEQLDKRIENKSNK